MEKNWASSIESRGRAKAPLRASQVEIENSRTENRIILGTSLRKLKTKKQHMREEVEVESRAYLWKIEPVKVQEEAKLELKRFVPSLALVAEDEIKVESKKFVSFLTLVARKMPS